MGIAIDQLKIKLDDYSDKLEARRKEFLANDGKIDDEEQKKLDHLKGLIEKLRSEITKQTGEVVNNDGETVGFDFSQGGMPPEGLNEDAMKVHKLLDELQKLVDIAAEEGHGKNANEMDAKAQKDIETKITFIMKATSDIKDKYADDGVTAAGELTTRLNAINNQLNAVKVKKKPTFDPKVGVAKKADFMPKTKEEEAEAAEKKKKAEERAKKLKEGNPRELLKEHITEEKKRLRQDEISNLEDKLANEEDPEKKQKLQEKINKKKENYKKNHEEDYQKPVSSANKPKNVSAKGTFTGGINLTLDQSGLALEASAEAGVNVTFKPRPIPIPSLASEIGVELGFNFGIKGAVKAAIKSEILTKVAVAKALPTPLNLPAIVDLLKSSPQDFGSVTLEGIIEPSLAGSVTVSLIVAKLIKLSIKGTLKGSVTTRLSVDFRNIKDPAAYLVGDVNGGIVLEAEASIGPSDEVAAVLSVISDGLVDEVTPKPVKLGSAEFFKIVSKPDTNPTKPISMFENVEFEKGQAFVDMINVIEQTYDSITEHVTFDEGQVKAIKELVGDPLGTSGKVVRGLNEVLTHDQISTFKFGPRDPKKEYSYDEDINYDLLVTTSGKKVSPCDYKIEVELELCFNGKRIDYTKKNNFELDDDGDTLREAYYLNVQKAYNKSSMKALYQKLGRKEFIQAVHTGVFVIKGLVTIDDDAKISTAPHRVKIRIPEGYEFDEKLKMSVAEEVAESKTSADGDKSGLDGDVSFVLKDKKVVYGDTISCLLVSGGVEGEAKLYNEVYFNNKKITDSTKEFQLSTISREKITLLSKDPFEFGKRTYVDLLVEDKGKEWVESQNFVIKSKLIVDKFIGVGHSVYTLPELKGRFKIDD